MLINQSRQEIVYAKKTPNEYKFPQWSLMLGWALSLLPLLALPVMLIVNVINFRASKKPLRELAELSPDWPKSHVSDFVDLIKEVRDIPTPRHSSSSLYKIRPIEISPTTLSTSGDTVTARPGKSVWKAKVNLLRVFPSFLYVFYFFADIWLWDLPCTSWRVENSYMVLWIQFVVLAL